MKVVVGNLNPSWEVDIQFRVVSDLNHQVHRVSLPRHFRPRNQQWLLKIPISGKFKTVAHLDLHSSACSET